MKINTAIIFLSATMFLPGCGGGGTDSEQPNTDSNSSGLNDGGCKAANDTCSTNDGSSDVGGNVVSYTIDSSVGADGSISPTSADFTHGSTASFTITPNTGYNINSVSGCGGTLAGNIYTTSAITAACTVSASFNPSLSIADASVSEGDSGTTNLIFTVSLSALANGDVNVDYVTSNDIATDGSDYISSSGTLTISSGTTSNTLSIVVNGDILQESDETLTVTLNNISANAILGDGSATGTIIDDDGVVVAKPLNDTGITWGGNYPSGNNATCIGETIKQQDCSHGRDVTHNDDSDGHAGFSYTKLDTNGNDLPTSATQWSCVKDNVTGLIWEVKQGGNGIDGDEGLHDSDDTFTWYNTSYEINGRSGYQDKYRSHCYGYTVDAAVSYCNTQAYTARVNAAGLCGWNDWRMPNKTELFGLVNLNRKQPAIDVEYFPNTQISMSSPNKLISVYRTSTQHPTNYNYKMGVNFDSGGVGYGFDDSKSSVRLVRRNP